MEHLRFPLTSGRKVNAPIRSYAIQCLAFPIRYPQVKVFVGPENFQIVPAACVRFALFTDAFPTVTEFRSVARTSSERRTQALRQKWSNPCPNFRGQLCWRSRKKRLQPHNSGGNCLDTHRATTARPGPRTEFYSAYQDHAKLVSAALTVVTIAASSIAPP